MTFPRKEAEIFLLFVLALSDGASLSGRGIPLLNLGNALQDFFLTYLYNNALDSEEVAHNAINCIVSGLV